jgi:enamine deaminase RidA (YjgF/YER057c/UK114 family)
MKRRNYGSGSRWEPIVGYSRAVRVGPHVHVAGTTVTNEAGDLIGMGDAYVQARQALSNIQKALERAGARLEHVVRTRVYVTDISNWEVVGRAHGEFFGEVRPVSTLVEVKGLIDPAMLVEIEADAYMPESNPEPSLRPDD